ncbi:hypothetical protein B0H19DRAFT_1262034 [Mycena capillaripes]|nr:hypothetical protein B0H19DRAFT_1262034 [Mycena capillaripes]
MPLSATFCNVPLSTSYNPQLESSVLSLDWVLSSGIPTSSSVVSGLFSVPCCDGLIRSMNVRLAVTASLPFDLVLGHDWMLYCRNSFPSIRFALTSGSIHACPIPSLNPVPNDSSMDIDGDVQPPPSSFSCARA